MNLVYEWRDAPQADFAVIGDPVSHSLSPRMHSAAYECLGLPYHYVAIRVDKGEVSRALEHLKAMGYKGVNATVPHKEEALEWCEIQEPLALRARAANTINLQSRTCINTDAPGFLATLKGVDLPSNSALILGAGGSARSILIALAGEGYELKLFNRTRSKAIDLAQELELPSGTVLDQADPSGAGLIVNTTSASLQKEHVPLDWDRASTRTLAYELMYAKEPTPFLAKAASMGMQTLDGRAMLMEQGALAFEWWTGIPAPRRAMAEALQ